MPKESGDAVDEEADSCLTSPDAEDEDDEASTDDRTKMKADDVEGWAMSSCSAV